jgi:hypothetical protein
LGAVQSSAFAPVLQPIEVQIHDRRRVQREDLTDHQSADDRDAERPPHFRAGAGAKRERQSAEHGRHRRHQNRPEAQEAGFENRVARALAFVPLGGQREVHHHDGVLLHDADEQDDADHRDHRQVRARDDQCQQRACARRGNRRQNRDRVDVAFVQHAEHDKDRGQGGCDQDRLAAERILIGLSGAGEHRVKRRRHSDLPRGAPDFVDRIAQGDPRCEVERDRYSGEEPLVIDGERGDRRCPTGERAQRDHRALRRSHEQIVQRGRALPVLGRDFHDHVILVLPAIHRRHLALTEGVVESSVDERRRDAVARGLVTVVVHERLQPVILLVAAHVGDDRNLPQLLQHPGRIGQQIGQVVALHRELILGVAQAPSDADVLRRLQVERCAGDLVQERAKTRNDLVGPRAASVERLQGDEQPRRIGRTPAAGEAHDVGHIRIGFDDLDEPQQETVHRLK